LRRKKLEIKENYEVQRGEIDSEDEENESDMIMNMKQIKQRFKEDLVNLVE
jgi:competence transcription factor ComK